MVLKYMANPSDRETLIMVNENVVCVVYSTGTFGSALINFINAHEGFLTTLPDIRLAQDGRAEGGILYDNRTGKLCFNEDYSNKYEYARKDGKIDDITQYDLPKGLRVAARQVGAHNIVKNIDEYKKKVLIDISGGGYKQFVLNNRSREVLITLTGKFEVAEDCNWNDDMIRESATHMLNNHIQEAKENRQVYQNTHKIPFHMIASQRHFWKWYNPLVEYLELKPLFDPLRYWKYSQHSFNKGKE